MSVEFRVPEAGSSKATPDAARPAFLVWLTRIENGLLVALLFGMMIIPISQLLRRRSSRSRR